MTNEIKNFWSRLAKTEAKQVIYLDLDPDDLSEIGARQMFNERYADSLNQIRKKIDSTYEGNREDDYEQYLSTWVITIHEEIRRHPWISDGTQSTCYYISADQQDKIVVINNHHQLAWCISEDDFRFFDVTSIGEHVKMDLDYKANADEALSHLDWTVLDGIDFEDANQLIENADLRKDGMEIKAQLDS